MSAEIKKIIEQELGAKGNLPLRKFAEWLMEGLSKDGDGTVSHATIINWKNGKFPNTDLLENMLSVYPVRDRRFQFALRLLAVKSPHVWGPDGVIWRLDKSSLTAAK